MKKIWIRLGGYIFADNETMAAIMNGDEEALLKAIKENGFELNGETYIPEQDDCGNRIDCEMEFDFDPTKLEIK